MRIRLTLTVLVVLAALTACSSSKAEPAAEPAPPTRVIAEADTTAPPPPPPTWPLTGLPLDDPAAAAHPAVVVKIDNSAEARPQTGINQADVVYELLVEGITRFALVYHSEQADPVGPVRSARTSDIHLLANLRKPLLVWSGGNHGVTEQVLAAEADGWLVNLSHDAVNDAYWRDTSRRAPHNLYTNTSDMLGRAQPGAVAPGPLFDFRAVGEAAPADATAIPGLSLRFEGVPGADVDYVWDPALGGWARFQVDGRHRGAKATFVDAAGRQVAPQNVVVLFTEYQPSVVDARSPQALSVGSGEALVLTDGRMIPATWSRSDPTQRLTLTGPDGQPVRLTPGRTWVAMPSPGAEHATVMTPERAAELSASRAG